MKEQFDWKTSKLAVQKEEMQPEQLDLFIDKLPNELISRNIDILKNSTFVKGKEGIFSLEDYEKYFNLTGSYKVSDLEALGWAKEFFTQREGRFFVKSGNVKEYLMRGPRYICAVDSNLSVRQKLEILTQDAVDAFAFLEKYKLSTEGQYKDIALVLDYVKNSAVTILSAYIFNEKTGKYDPNDEAYNTEKIKLIDLVRKFSFAYYLALLDRLDQGVLDELLKFDLAGTLGEASEKLKHDFESHTFYNDALSRPEASHPLAILGSTGMILSKHEHTDTVVGMPSGSTEIACVLAEAYESFLKRPCEVVLLPISRHTGKQLNVGEEDNDVALSNFLSSVKDKLEGKNVVIVDDNSSTGGTIERARDVIVQGTNPGSIVATVVEADLIRSGIDRNSKKRDKVAHPILYESSVSVLPVSRRIREKYDLKQIMEINQLIKFYKEKIKEAKTLAEKIKYEVFIDDLENPTETVLESAKAEDVLDKFQGTFLSNFYATPVEHNGIVYPSVEHAYQAAKFSPETFSSLDELQRSELSEILKQKGYAQPVDDFGQIFTEPTVTSGITKVVASKLREWGFVRKDWDDVRIEIMIDLLIQKFKNPELKQRLHETQSLYLMEGNEWEDTLWGVCNGKGKNLLGRTLMQIRKIE